MYEGSRLSRTSCLIVLLQAGIVSSFYHPRVLKFIARVDNPLNKWVIQIGMHIYVVSSSQAENFGSK